MRKLTTFGLTDVGRKRAHNEDAYEVADDLGLFIVCDGMGGHASGEVASRITVDDVADFVRRHRTDDPATLPYKIDPIHTPAEALLSNAVQHANDRVYVEGMKDAKREGMGTTLVAVLADEEKLVIAHVGDSRIYRWSTRGALEQVTRDHSLLNYKIDKGEITTPKEITEFKQGNIIVRAVGLKDYVEPEVHTLRRRHGDVYLLCSDGLNDMVDDWSIQNVLEVNADSLAEGATCLIRMANDRGGKDNITVLLIRVDDEVDAVARAEETDPRGVRFHEETTDPAGIGVVPPPESARPDAADEPEQPRVDWGLLEASSPPPAPPSAPPTRKIAAAPRHAAQPRTETAAKEPRRRPRAPVSDDAPPSIIIDDSLLD